jgi:hypothetical protein
MAVTTTDKLDRKSAKPYGSIWRCSYWYPSNVVVGNDVSEYLMRGYYDGDDIVFESLPAKDKSYMFVRLTVDGRIATGNWYENTSPTGEFKGAIYSGAGQLLVNPMSGAMEGQWAGAGYDHKLKQMRIYSGRWEIFPATEQEIEEGKRGV